MIESGPQFLTVGNGASERRIAYLIGEARGDAAPGVMWLNGFKSEMTSTKASVVAAWAAERSVACTRFDYSGHGQSGGRFEDGTIGQWLEETVAVFTRLTCGPQIVIGSSMGGYITLLMLRELMRTQAEHADRIKALILIAPAWDMTERLMWQRFPESVKRQIADTGVYMRPSAYGDGDYAITGRLIEEGCQHLIGDAPFDPGRPVVILHGLLDPDVPWEHTLDLVAHLDGDQTEVIAVPDGEHRLSRPEDLDLLRRTLDRLNGAAAP